MIKGKDGKWYPTKAKMLEANQPKAEDVIGKKLVTEGTITEEQRQEIENLPIADNSKPFQKRMQQIDSIFKMKEQQKTEVEIASKLGIAKSYVEEVVSKGYEQIEIELRQQYHIPEEVISQPQEESEIPKDLKPKKEKKKNVVKAPKEKKDKKESLWQIIERLTPDEPFTPAEMVEMVQEAYPDTYKDTSVKLHLAGLDAANPKSEHNFPSLFKHAFLERIGEGKETQYQRKN